jgi:hypothetical protein
MGIGTDTITIFAAIKTHTSSSARNYTWEADARL